MRIHSGLGVSDSTRKPNIRTRLMSEKALFAQPEESIYGAAEGSRPESRPLLPEATVDVVKRERLVRV